MNHMILPKRPERRRVARQEQPARLELVLELPRDPESPAVEDDSAEPAQERGTAVVDFYI